MAKQNSIQKRFCVLKIFGTDPLHTAKTRSLLNGWFYIEVDNTFIISLTNKFKDQLSLLLSQDEIKYLLVFTNLKTGCDIASNGMDSNDVKNIKKIVTE